MIADPDLLLDASGVAKSFGAVRALTDAHLTVARGEVVALMGANGAGKSTFVKILTGALRPDAGHVRVRGREAQVGSPAQARRSGLVPVYQEPSLIPDLDVGANLRLADTPVEPFRRWMDELGHGEVRLTAMIRDLPLATLRIVDLARALASEPDVLLLDELTAALPTDLVEKVLKVARRQAEDGRGVIYISHRFSEIADICDRASVLRDGRTVGEVEIAEGVEDRVVEMMLGTHIDLTRRAAESARPRPEGPPRLKVDGLAVAPRLTDATFTLHPGEVLGVVALEGQGQDELFEALAGFRKPRAGRIEVDGAPARFGHPADAIAAGLTFVPGNRAEALFRERSVRENIAMPFSAPPRAWGPLKMGHERERVAGAIDRLQIDTRAQGEVQRLSGGNQQKVTIGRWLAHGVRTLLLFDPTRGIDVRTKRQIYPLVRELARQGAAILYYTSELDEVPLACDRAIVIFNGRIVDIVEATEADEERLMRAAYGLTAAESVSRGRGMSFVQKNAWSLGLLALFVVLLGITKVIQPNFGVSGLESLARSALPFAFATAAMAVVVIVGGIDLSVASMMAVCAVTAAVLMQTIGGVPAILITLAVGTLMGLINGTLVVITRVPDIVVTLAMLFVWEGTALLILETPGGTATPWMRSVIVGSFLVDGLPKALLLVAIVVAAVWIPIRRSKLGLAIYATGSDETAAFRSGVAVGPTRAAAYAVAGLFCGFGGLSLLALTGVGEPVPGPYLLAAVASVVLGGVILGGGIGGLLGPIIAVFILRIIRTILTLANVDPNVTTIVEGTIMVGVVMFGAFLVLRSRRVA